MMLPAVFETYKESLDATLRSAFEGRDMGIYQMQRYHLGWIDAEGRPSSGQGKGLRPMMCLFACQAAGGDWRKALNAAAAMELVHNFSLIQRRHSRRGYPAPTPGHGVAQVGALPRASMQETP